QVDDEARIQLVGTLLPAAFVVIPYRLYHHFAAARLQRLDKPGSMNVGRSEQGDVDHGHTVDSTFAWRGEQPSRELSRRRDCFDRRISAAGPSSVSRSRLRYGRWRQCAGGLSGYPEETFARRSDRADYRRG